MSAAVCKLHANEHFACTTCGSELQSEPRAELPLLCLCSQLRWPLGWGGAGIDAGCTAPSVCLREAAAVGFMEEEWWNDIVPVSLPSHPGGLCPQERSPMGHAHSSPWFLSRVGQVGSIPLANTRLSQDTDSLGHVGGCQAQNGSPQGPQSESDLARAAPCPLPHSIPTTVLP